MSNTLPFEVLDELFKADLVAGKLFWKHRPPSHFATENGLKVFEAVFAGKEALTGRNPSGCHGRIMLCGDSFHVQRSRIIWAMRHGAWSSLKIGHRNLDRYDDRIDNLVEWTQSQQSAYARRTTGKTGVKGVSPTRSGKFLATVFHDGRQNYVGTFDTLDAARIARNAAALELHGEFARITGPISQDTGAAS